MNRRFFLASTAGTLLATAFLPTSAYAEMVEYSPGLIQKHLAAGKTIFVDYSASWCGTCARQERVINALREANPNYDRTMVFVRVDWDDYRRHEVTTSRKIPRRSTLLVLKGNQELGRVVAGTSEQQIKALLDTGLQAGS
ncbi:thioredoxin family protein [Roseibium sp. MMSF_3544]|uniref:thioredoxin family protein n=1 Tax=unclassified Roseibium TaxID=2629323 RepID=UPI00273E39EB|nr:thioredoxin family protein [Roseibium sp. MMSF_3544]